ncbi:MAG: hypothetical protein ABIA78_01360 [archaeon]
MKKQKSKKAISIMIGYVLLISFAVIIGVIVFQWLKTYVPRESLECSEGTSLFIKDYDYDCILNTLDLTITNNGRFNIGGYFIKATNSSEQELATYDLSNFSTGDKIGNIVKFQGIENSFKPDNPEETHVFDLSTSGFGTIYSVEIIPIRWQTENNKKQLVSCSNAKVKEFIYCS